MYEIYDHLSDTEQAIKSATKEHIEKGIEYRKLKQWSEAKAAFQAAQEKAPNDPLIEHHLTQIHLLQLSDLPQDWDGSILLRP